MPSKKLALTNKGIDDLIREIRGQKVILDTDLAALYGVPTKRLNEQFRRNRKRFPDDFAFQLTIEEDEALRSQNATSSLHGGRRYRPYVFTEHGALQAANILNSPDAVRMSLFVIRAFVKMREDGAWFISCSASDVSMNLTALSGRVTTATCKRRCCTGCSRWSAPRFSGSCSPIRDRSCT